MSAPNKTGLESVQGEAPDPVNVCKQAVHKQDEEEDESVALSHESLMDSGKFTDVLLVVGQKEFAAHKAILTARSGLFAAIFEQPMKETLENRVEITDMDSEVFAELLRYIYTATTPA